MTEIPAHIGSLINGLARRYRWHKRFSRKQIWEQWPDIAGDAIAEHSWPFKFREQDVLVITVSDSVWMQQLSLQKLALIDAINRRLPPEAMVRELHFTLGDVVKAKAFFRSASIPHREPQDQRPQNLPPEMESSIREVAEAITEPVKDAELKHALQRAYRKSRMRLMTETHQS